MTTCQPCVCRRAYTRPSWRVPGSRSRTPPLLGGIPRGGGGGDGGREKISRTSSRGLALAGRRDKRFSYHVRRKLLLNATASCYLAIAAYAFSLCYKSRTSCKQCKIRIHRKYWPFSGVRGGSYAKFFNVWVGFELVTPTKFFRVLNLRFEFVTQTKFFVDTQKCPLAHVCCAVCGLSVDLQASPSFLSDLVRDELHIQRISIVHIRYTTLLSHRLLVYSAVHTPHCQLRTPQGLSCVR